MLPFLLAALEKKKKQESSTKRTLKKFSDNWNYLTQDADSKQGDVPSSCILCLSLINNKFTRPNLYHEFAHVLRPVLTEEEFVC